MNKNFLSFSYLFIEAPERSQGAAPDTFHLSTNPQFIIHFLRQLIVHEQWRQEDMICDGGLSIDHCHLCHICELNIWWSEISIGYLMWKLHIIKNFLRLVRLAVVLAAKESFELDILIIRNADIGIDGRCAQKDHVICRLVPLWFHIWFFRENLFKKIIIDST